MEKRCSTDVEENEIAFDEILLRKATCVRTMDASQAYCSCLGNYCNKDSLLEQIEKLLQRLSFINYSNKIHFFLI